MGNKFRDIFHPEEKLKDKRLSGNSPCIDCANIHRYNRSTSWQEEPVNPKECENCMNKIRYEIDCMIKLRWYEEHDNRIKDLEVKDKYKYDCGVKCPESLHDGYPVLYPDGWA